MDQKKQTSGKTETAGQTANKIYCGFTEAEKKGALAFMECNDFEGTQDKEDDPEWEDKRRREQDENARQEFYEPEFFSDEDRAMQLNTEVRPEPGIISDRR